MLLGILLTLFFIIIALLIFSPLKKSFLLIGLLSSFLLMLCGLFIYIIKMNGFTISQQNQLFASRKLLAVIKNIPLTLNAIGSMVVSGRVLFCYFLLSYAVRRNWRMHSFFMNNKYLYLLLALPILIILLVFNPKPYFALFSYKYVLQDVMTVGLSFVLAVYIIAAVSLLVLEYFDISLSWYKKRFAYLSFSMLIIIVYYCVFAFLDPVNIFQDFSGIRTSFASAYFSGEKVLNTWLIISGVGLIAIGIACAQTIIYLRFDYNKDKLELTIKKKQEDASLASTVLVHGIKNQILSAKMLSTKINKLSMKNACSSEDLQEIRGNSEKLIEINQNILNRMTFFYNSFRNIQMTLVAVTISELFAMVAQKVEKKHSKTVVTYDYVEGIIIADKELLSEAIYNLIINAIDATSKQACPMVSVKQFTTRAHNIIVVKDNGVGINKAERNKIFIPFFTSKNTNHNWGLGLCYVRQIVKKHMGEVRVESVPSEGTEFYISLTKFVKKQ